MAAKTDLTGFRPSFIEKGISMRVFPLVNGAVCCVLYYCFAKWLPPSYLPACGWAKWMRYQVCRHMFSRCGKNVTVERKATFRSGREITIGDNSGIGENCRLSGPVHIGSDVMMGPNCIFWTRDHAFSRTDIPMTRQGFEPPRPITIGNDVWIGCNCIFHPGVTIGEGAVLGYGSVITEDVPAWAVVVGNPARVVQYRKENLEPCKETLNV